ncbi:MAG TPA: 4Fe-4S double cluster binding domain-containing protein [Lachnospiraceae bacterium]|nr:4Fe-4S double cluster binding domain-containing protein [Lachnospiraceae bacterium]
MLEKLRAEAKIHNNKLVMLPIKRLYDLQKELEEFRDTEELNGFQQWILSDIYKFDLPEVDFTVNSLILVAVPHPIYVDVTLHYQGKSYQTKGLGVSDMTMTCAYITKVVSEAGHQVQEIGHFPLKRLAVQSGLATYGRNNITYVDEYGSNISYIAFVSDAMSEEDTWRPMCHAQMCDNCTLCLSACPTGAIRPDRFLINNEICLSCLNEGGGEFPDWLPKDVHHTIYDCLRCQEKCPMNLKVKDPNEIIQTLDISEEETEMLLAGKRKEDFPEEFIKRTDMIGLFAWDVTLSRNIRAIIEANA